MALYRNDSSGLFTDEAGASGIARISMKSLTFGTFFFDYDLDGLPDVLAINGHVSDDISVIQPTLKYALPFRIAKSDRRPRRRLRRFRRRR